MLDHSPSGPLRFCSQRGFRLLIALYVSGALILEILELRRRATLPSSLYLVGKTDFGEPGRPG